MRSRGAPSARTREFRPGLRRTRRAPDPFYTTKPVGKAIFLGLSICYGMRGEISLATKDPRAHLTGEAVAKGGELLPRLVVVTSDRSSPHGREAGTGLRLWPWTARLLPRWGPPRASKYKTGTTYRAARGGSLHRR